MRFVPTAVEGAMIIELDVHTDSRGSFARTYCEREFANAGIHMRVVQTNISRNPQNLTLRGMHYQEAPYGEPKIVQCLRGRIFDVAVDMRPDSPSYCCWAAVELSPEMNHIFFIPQGCAHGFLTLEPDSAVMYLMGSSFVAGAGRGVRWNDPAFGIKWPALPVKISERDAAFPDYPKSSEAI